MSIYKYILTENKYYHNLMDWRINYKNQFGEIKNGNVTVFKDYAWDGCSVKFKIFGRIFGTPDGRYNETKWASCIHDYLYQFHEKINRQNVPTLKRKRVDDIFYDELKKAKWKLADTYYFFVRLFGGIFWKTDY